MVDICLAPWGYLVDMLERYPQLNLLHCLAACKQQPRKQHWGCPPRPRKEMRKWNQTKFPNKTTATWPSRATTTWVHHGPAEPQQHGPAEPQQHGPAEPRQHRFNIAQWSHSNKAQWATIWSIEPSLGSFDLQQRQVTPKLKTNYFRRRARRYAR